MRTRLQGSGLGELHIRWRFRIVVLAFGLPFLAYIVWSAAQQAILEKEHVRDRARANATLVASRFEDHIEQVDRLLATIAQSVSGRIDDLPEIDRLLHSMHGYLPKSVDNIGVWSPAGDAIASLDQRSATRKVNVKDRVYFQEAVAHRDLAFEGPIRSRTTGLNIIQFARPVIDVKGSVVGVISMAIRTTQLIAVIDPDNLITDSSLVTILDQRGTIVARSVEPELWIGKQVGDVAGLTAAFASRGGTREETGIDGRQRLAGYAVVGRWPWIVMAGEPIEQVTGPIGDRLLRNLGIGLAIFALAMLIAGRVAAWTTTPLMQLADDTERLGRGELAHRSAVATGGEIATLAANFNRMAAAIEQRDLALAASRTQLKAITDNVPEQITYIDRDERYRFVNEHAGPFANVPSDMIGRTIREVRGEALYRDIAPRVQRAIAGERQCVEISALVDGRMTHFFVTYVPDVGADGEVAGVYAFAHDITQRKTAELLLAESEKRLLLITDNLPAMVCYVDEARRFRFANRAFEKWLERPLDQVIGESFDRLMAPELAARLDYHFLRCLRGETLEFEMEVPVRTDVGPRWLRCNFIPDRAEAGGNVRGVYGMIHNVSKSKEAEERLTRLAQFDTLTGLANRNQFNETLARVLDGNDVDRQPLALMFLDIDHFKQVNDRYGHAGGDLLLKDFAERLADCVRTSDAVARLSGDEFVVLLEGMHSDDEPQFIARKIIAAVEKPFTMDDQVVHVTTSIGIAMRAHPHEPASTLMKRADEALYEAKRAGRNTFRLAG